MKYIVKKETGYYTTNHCPYYETVKIFQTEPEAIAFFQDSKNLDRYGILYLERCDEDGNRLELNMDKKE